MLNARLQIEMKPETLEILRSALPAFCALLGTALGIFGSAVITHMSQKSEERKQLRALCFEAGVENWKGAVQIVIAQGKGTIEPFEAFILNMVYLSEMIKKGYVSKEEVKAFILKKNETIKGVSEAQDEIEAQTENKSENKTKIPN